VSVTLRAKRGASQLDHVRVFTSGTLPERLVIPRLESASHACQRIDRRRIDCETRSNPGNEEDSPTCLDTSAYRLFPGGILFARPYGPGCHRKPIPFDRRPKWTAPWRAWPLR
jgi:hypothetical protein